MYSTSKTFYVECNENFLFIYFDTYVLVESMTESNDELINKANDELEVINFP